MEEAVPDAKRRKIQDAVIDILKASDLGTATEYGVRTTTAQRLGLDLTHLQDKLFVRNLIESFLLSPEVTATLVEHHGCAVAQGPQCQQQQQELERENQLGNSGGVVNSNESSSRVICKLSGLRNVSIGNFNGKRFVSFRDYHKKDGKLFHSGKGISLSAKQWSSFRNSFPAIQEAITKMEAHQSRLESVGKQAVADMPNSAVDCTSGGLNATDGKQNATSKSTSIATVNHQEQSLVDRQVEADVSSSVAFTPQNSVQHDSLVFAAQRLVPLNTRLDGKNYHRWKHQMEIYFEQLQIAYVLTQPCPGIASSPEVALQDRATVQKWINDDYLCCQNILCSLSDHLFNQYSKKSYSAREIWDELKSRYDDDFGTVRSQINRYIHFQMVDGISVLEQVQELQNIANSIMASGIWIDENFHASVIISKLPPSWRVHRARLMHEDLLPLNLLLHRLKLEEDYRYGHRKERNFNNAQVAEPKHENKFGPRRMETKKSCYTCGKEGHISRFCPDRRNEATEKSNGNSNSVLPVVIEANLNERTAEG